MQLENSRKVDRGSYTKFDSERKWMKTTSFYTQITNGIAKKYYANITGSIIPDEKQGADETNRVKRSPCVYNCRH